MKSDQSKTKAELIRELQTLRKRVSAQDITERKPPEGDVTESETIYQQLYDKAPVGYHQIDSEGRIVSVNKTELNMLRYTADEMIGKHIYQFIKDKDLSRQAVMAKVSGNVSEVHAYERIFIRKDGSEIPVLVEDRLIKDVEGKITGIRTTIQDITERKQAEEALKESEHRYQRLFEDSPVSLWEEDYSEVKAYVDMLKTKGVTNFREYFDENPDELTICAQKVKILDVNNATLALHGVESKEELLGNLDKVFTDKSFEVMKEELIMFAEGGMLFESEATVKTLSGEHRDIHLRFSVVQAGEIGSDSARVLLAISDITQLKHAEEVLRNSNQLKETLLDIITHDLKNPVGVIHGIAVMMLEEHSDNDMLEIIKDSSDTLLKVINNATTLAQVTLGDKIKMDEFDITEAIQSVGKEFSTQLKQSGMTITIDIPDKLLIKANPIISEVFSNYISNAIKYASKGRKILIDSWKEDEFLKINVKDFGTTIPENKRHEVFDRGVQLEDDRKRGRGLGLAIVKRIAVAHNAEVGVKPNKTKGNIFYIAFPIN